MTQWSEDLIPIERARTLDGLFYQRVRRAPERVAYRYYDRTAGEWRQWTWAEMGAMVARWRAALAREQVRPGDRVGILLRNCPEWIIFDQAALSLGLVTVPLYTDDRADSTAYIVTDAAIKVSLVQDVNRWRRIDEALGESAYPLRVVVADSVREPARDTGEDPRVVSLADWLPTTVPELTQREGNASTVSESSSSTAMSSRSDASRTPDSISSRPLTTASSAERSRPRGWARSGSLQTAGSSNSRSTSTRRSCFSA